MHSKKHRLGLSGKLVLVILVVGTIPLIVGLSIAYYRGKSELQEVIGASFQALAEDSAAKVNVEIQRIITVDHMLAQHAAGDSSVRTTLQGNHFRGKDSSIFRFDWPVINETASATGILNASWVTGPEGGPNRAEDAASSPEKAITRVSMLHPNSTAQNYLLRISTPIHVGQENTLIGWLHRDYDVKKLFDHLIYPIRFGYTGHVMLIDNLGTIISCPLLATGSLIEDQTLLTRVTNDQAGWITTKNDGHGRRVFSIVGHAPLAEVNHSLQPGESWHMFVWRDSGEIFAPAQSFLIGVALTGLFSLVLLGALGFYASRRIVKPIQRLRQEARLITDGNLNQSLVIHTGDEIQELADGFDTMRIQLRQHFETLEEKVEERTRELRENQAEKDRVVEQLIQAEKVSAIGTMVSGIGHEINNPLYVIMGKAEAIRDEKDISECNEHARDIIKHAKHISAIVKNLSGYIRPTSQHELENTDVHEGLTEAIAMAKRLLLDDRIEIRQNFSPVPNISARPEEIQQVLFNVIRNGIQAMVGKGVLEITTTLEDSQVCIRIRDTGTGIKTEHLGKIFDPFFTTKGPNKGESKGEGEGEGLGMYIVKNIVNKYNGTITLESQAGKGTTVTIRFPGV